MSENKRLHPRVVKNYVIKYALTANGDLKHDISNVIDIGRGGLKFFAPRNFAIDECISFFIQFPFLYPQIIQIQGLVVGCEEISAGKIYKIRIAFKDVSPTVLDVFNQLEKINKV